MGIWIRSQDGNSLVESKEVWISKQQDKKYILNLKANTLNWYKGGIYSTEEKALKVLDMIQKELCNLRETEDLPSIVQIIENPTKQLFFQMPQDEEVEA